MIANATNEAATQDIDNLTVFRRTGNLARPKGLTQLLDIQQKCYERAMRSKTDHEDFAALARAFCLLEERIRIRRGIPLPGQLRPDLPPMKGLKGARRRQALIDLAGGSNAKSFVEAVAAVAAEGGATEIEEHEPPTTDATTTREARQPAAKGVKESP